MHYYQFNIGNYRRRTGHLTMLEHGAYRALLDTYYLEEKPLCADDAQLMRSHCARTTDEQQALKNVLRDFFELREDGYFHKDVEEKLVNYRKKSEKASLSAKSRWEKDANAMRTHSDGNANHKPITNNQEPITTNHKESKPLSGKPDESAPKTSKPKTNGAETSEVISYLNEKAGTNFHLVEANTKLVAARLREGATLAEIKRVIDFKVSEWSADSKMRDYLRPATLFNAEKFAQYAGQVAVVAVSVALVCPTGYPFSQWKASSPAERAEIIRRQA